MTVSGDKVQHALMSKIFRRHWSTTYVDTAYCYRRSSVVSWSVCLSVCHDREPCKKAERIEMSFGMWIRVGPSQHVLDESHWRNLANTTKPSICGGDAAFLSNYFYHLLIVLKDRNECRRFTYVSVYQHIFYHVTWESESFIGVWQAGGSIG